MSKQFRQKFLKELEKETTPAYRKIVAQFFDRGEIRIERDKWNIVYQNAHLSSLQKAGAVVAKGYVPPNLPDKVWKKMFIQLKGTTAPKLQQGRKIGSYGAGNLVRFIKSRFTYSDTMIRMPYIRGKAKNGNPYKGNLERRADLDVRSFMTKFCNSKHFVAGVKVSLKKASEQVYEHGKTGEQDFLEGAYTNINPYDKSGRTDGSISDAKGAQGVVTDQRIANFLIKEAKGAYKTEQWFTSVFEAVFAKWQDLFGYDTELDHNDKADSVNSVVTFSGAMVPADSKFNPGNVDRLLLEDMKRFISSREFFVAETMRLNSKVNAKTADQMFSDSPPPSKRLEEAAIKLAAANVLENIEDKVIRKRKKVGKPKANKKRGSPTRAKRSGNSRSGVKTTRANVRKRGRPTKQAQALGGNVLALKELINKVLPDVILQKMQSPALVNRTGRFRRSAEVTNAMIGPKGGVQIDYTYQRDPYGVFEPGSGSPLANQYRDPRAIIGGSVREIAQSIMGKKFVRVRRV